MGNKTVTEKNLVNLRFPLVYYGSPKAVWLVDLTPVRPVTGGESVFCRSPHLILLLILCLNFGKSLTHALLRPRESGL